MSDSRSEETASGDIVKPEDDLDRHPGKAYEPPKVGEWFWVKGSKDEWLGCVVHVGSNYIELVGPVDENCRHHDRVHFNEISSECRSEPAALAIIAAKIEEQKAVISDATKKICEVANRLSLGETEHASALTVYRGDAIGSYKQELVGARDKGLPELREVIREASKIMKGWMQAEAIPLGGYVRTYEHALELIGKRIWGVELYAGLVEEAKVLFDGGSPAGVDEPVHVFQRRHYMDEECLANYEVGGMSFSEIEDFDNWLLKSENFNRILPHPRSVVAFRVRRVRREGESFDDLIEFVEFLFGGRDEKDLQTFLYMRNGDRLSRITTSMDFGEKLFPDIEKQVLASGTVYAVKPFSKIERLATEGEYLESVRLHKELDDKLAQIPDGDVRARWKLEGEYRRYVEPDNFVEWSRDNVYYDDIGNYVNEQIENHNRLVLVLQGLFDRSETFFPHPPVKLWVGEDFRRAVKLVYDDDRALVPGDLPDFLAYQSQVNAQLRSGSLCVGQEDYWLRREAEKENARLVSKYGHEKSYYMLKKRHWPGDNPGPGLVAMVREFSPRKGCMFKWERAKIDRRSWRREDTGETVGSSVRVPTTQLLCLEGYQPGDYKKFYADPRTRARYLEWAPLLLRAEEWCQGKLVLGKPSKENWR